MKFVKKTEIRKKHLDSGLSTYFVFLVQDQSTGEGDKFDVFFGVLREINPANGKGASADQYWKST